MRAGQVWHGFARKCGWTFPFTSYTDLHVSLAKGFLFFLPESPWVFMFRVESLFFGV